jgi:hypothetical protein
MQLFSMVWRALSKIHYVELAEWLKEKSAHLASPEFKPQCHQKESEREREREREKYVPYTER